MLSEKIQSNLLSPAKLNLTLLVTGKRDDGYHDISSLFTPISLYDEVHLAVEDVNGESDSITVTCDNSNVPCDSTNLVWKAAEFFLARAGLEKKIHVCIDIKKNIPVGAGLGGGSSNAACVLLGLNRLSGGCLDAKKISEIALSIGSDVPFFLLESAAIASGRGEILRPVELPTLHYVLINPGFPVTAAWAYDNLVLTKRSENNKIFDSEETILNLKEVVENVRNDLEAAVSEKYSVINDLKVMLAGAGAASTLMSGSGPTVFGLFYDQDKARQACKELKKTVSSLCRVFYARGL